MIIKMAKKVLLLLLLILVAANPVYAEKLVVPKELDEYGERIYAGAHSYYPRKSFSGYCGTYVGCQLRAMGIFSGDTYFRGNGNQWYGNFDNVDMTSGGYYVYRESGRDCLANLSDKYGNELDNIVLSFPVQAGYSYKYPGAGHALVIYKLKDGVAYYSESFSYGNHPEGDVIAEDADELIERYSKRHGNPIGCVLLSKTDLYASFCNAEFVAMLEESMESLNDVSYVAQQLMENYTLA